MRVDSIFDLSAAHAEFKSAGSLVLPTDTVVDSNSDEPESLPNSAGNVLVPPMLQSADAAMAVDSLLDSRAARDEESAGNQSGAFPTDMAVNASDLPMCIESSAGCIDSGGKLTDHVPGESSEHPTVQPSMDATTSADTGKINADVIMYTPVVPQLENATSETPVNLLAVERQSILEWIMAVRKVHANFLKEGKLLCASSKPAILAAFGYLREQAKAKQAGFILKHFDVFAPFVAMENRSRSGPLCKQLKQMQSTQAKQDRSVPVPHSQPDCLIGGEIRHYQLAGLQWLVTQHNMAACSILGDEMGLGKTLQVNRTWHWQAGRLATSSCVADCRLCGLPQADCQYPRSTPYCGAGLCPVGLEK
jgi:hypothetical protein